MGTLKTKKKPTRNPSLFPSWKREREMAVKPQPQLMCQIFDAASLSFNKNRRKRRGGRKFVEKWNIPMSVIFSLGFYFILFYFFTFFVCFEPSQMLLFCTWRERLFFFLQTSHRLCFLFWYPVFLSVCLYVMKKLPRKSAEQWTDVKFCASPSSLILFHVLLQLASNSKCS